MQNFRELVVWQKAHELTLAVYRATREFPREELYGLVTQVRRAAASIAANIAEGRCRGSDPDFARFLNMAMGSAAETEYHLLLSRDLGFLKSQIYEQLDVQVTEVKR